MTTKPNPPAEANKLAAKPVKVPPLKQQHPSVGRIVHYVLESGSGAGAHRPAIIVRVWEGSGVPALVQLQVFTDGPNDGFLGRSGDAGDPVNTVWRSSVKHDDAQSPGTWHWPEMV